MTEPRRVRTQVERAADGTAWRYHEHGERISDGATDRPLPPVPDCCYPPDAVDLPVEALRMFDPQTMSGTRYAETLRAAFAESAAAGKPVLLADGSAEVSAYQPRRRWWHRLTRALAGRWLHVLTPGFLRELFNDIWSHAAPTHPEEPVTQPTGSDYVRAVVEQLVALDVPVDLNALDLDEEQCNIPIANFDEIVWLRWLDDPEHGWHFTTPGGERCAAICAPDTPVDEAARILARYV